MEMSEPMSEDQILTSLMAVLREEANRSRYLYENVVAYGDRIYPGWQNSTKGIAELRLAIAEQTINTEEVSNMVDNRSNEVPQEQSSLVIKSSLDTVSAEEFSLSLEQGALKAKALFAAITAAGEGYGYSTIGSAKVKHIKYDGWALVCRAYGSSLAVEQVEVTRAPNNGPIIRAVATAAVIRDTDGVVTGRAIAECNRQEPNWKNKPDYALVSMAGTRACGKAARLKYSWVLLLSQLFKENNWSFTPEEEMDGVQIIESKPANHGQEYIPDQEHVVCAECGSPMRQRHGVKGPFLGCSNYPDCKHTQNMPISEED